MLDCRLLAPRVAFQKIRLDSRIPSHLEVVSKKLFPQSVACERRRISDGTSALAGLAVSKSFTYIKRCTFRSSPVIYVHKGYIEHLQVLLKSWSRSPAVININQMLVPRSRSHLQTSNAGPAVTVSFPIPKLESLRDKYNTSVLNYGQVARTLSVETRAMSREIPSYIVLNFVDGLTFILASNVTRNFRKG